MADADKTLDPTPHRRQRALEQGQVAKSPDLGSAMILLVGLCMLLALGKGLVGFLVRLTERQIGGEWLTGQTQFGADEAATQWNATVFALSEQMLPIFAVLLVTGIAVSVIQVGFRFLPNRLAWNLSRINPIQGLGRVFSLDGVAKTFFALVKTILILAVAGYVLYNQRDTILGLGRLPSHQMAASLLELIAWSSIKIAVALFLLAIVDYGFQRWKLERDMRMTPQELREELRNLEPSREITSRRKQLRHQMRSGTSKVDGF